MFQFGFIEVYSYGFFLALGILAATLWLIRKVEKKGVSRQLVIDFVLLEVVAGIVGARLAYIILYDPWYYLAHPLRMVMPWEGGLAFYGSLILCLPIAFIFLRRTKVPVWAFFDLAAPCLMLGYAIARFGCFFNGCCYGKPAGVPWAVVFPAIDNLTRHPTQLYSVLSGLIIFAILEFLAARIRFRGQIVASMFILYGLSRSFIELFRENLSLWGGASTASLAALGLAVAGGMLYWHLARRGIDPASSDLRPDN